MLYRREGVSLGKLLGVGLLASFFIYFLLSSSSSSSPNVQKEEQLVYAVVLDAGSTGSRVHVYSFKNKEIVSEVFEQVKPGLSSYENDPQGAANSLKGLLDIAKDTVPASLRKCTPLILRATAGLRLLSGDKSQKILESVHQYMETYGFHMPDDAVDIMGGEDEGVYAWITVNFLLKRFSSNSKKPTVAVMDLGGGSTQIVFEPKDSSVLKDAPSDNKFSLNFGKHSYHLYQNSYLGYGLMEARKKVLKTNRQVSCLPDGFKDEIKHDGNTLEIEGSGGSFTDCSAQVFSILDKEKSCESTSCSFAGIYQPSFEHFPNELYAFSYFYDRTETMSSPFPDSISPSDYLSEARRVCGKETPESKKNPHLCLDLTFIYKLLNDGYGVPDKKSLVLAKKIAGYETGWCLGAAIKVLETMDHVCDK